jgi:hypothetical protein
VEDGKNHVVDCAPKASEHDPMTCVQCTGCIALHVPPTADGHWGHVTVSNYTHGPIGVAAALLENEREYQRAAARYDLELRIILERHADAVFELKRLSDVQREAERIGADAFNICNAGGIRDQMPKDTPEQLAEVEKYERSYDIKGVTTQSMVDRSNELAEVHARAMDAIVDFAAFSLPKHVYHPSDRCLSCKEPLLPQDFGVYCGDCCHEDGCGRVCLDGSHFCDLHGENEDIEIPPEHDLSGPICLTPEAMAKVNELIKNPPAPTPALIKLFAKKDKPNG